MRSDAGVIYWKEKPERTEGNSDSNVKRLREEIGFA